MQTFDVLKNLAKYHSFTVGLVTGGRKGFREEQRGVVKTNCLVATPGRLLSHFEGTYGFHADDLRVFVIDEADKVLDLGFKNEIDRIVGYLPEGRQTFLFSATQSKKVSDLARLSLSRPVYVRLGEDAPSLNSNSKSKPKTNSYAIPPQLKQTYITVPLPLKISVLYSFIKTHLKTKSIIFLSSRSQVKFFLALFSGFQPGVPLMALHGKMAMEKRTNVYFDFCRKKSAVLFATDVASRGLDFPDVEWVVQVDAPEDVEMYVHRVGRTGRNGKPGSSLLMLGETEEPGFIASLANNEIKVKKLSVNPNKAIDVEKKTGSVVASDLEINRLAKKAFVGYLRCLVMMPNKNIFKIREIDTKGYARSLGLAGEPSARFKDQGSEKTEDLRTENREKKNKSRKLEKLKQMIKEERLKKRLQKLGETKTLMTMTATSTRCEDDDDEEEGLLVVKKKHKWGEGAGNVSTSSSSSYNSDSDLNDPVSESNTQKNNNLQIEATKRKAKKQKIRIDGTAGYTKVMKFDEDGIAVDDKFSFRELANEGGGVVGSEELARANAQHVEMIRTKLLKNKDRDKMEERARVHEQRKKRKFERREAPLTEGRENDGDDIDIENIDQAELMALKMLTAGLKE